MNRAQLIEKAAQAIRGKGQPWRAMDWSDAEAVVDALLPQVATVEELEALPLRSIFLDREGWAWEVYPRPADNFAMRPAEIGYRSTRSNYQCTSKFVLNRGPLTVVWQP